MVQKIQYFDLLCPGIETSSFYGTPQSRLLIINHLKTGAEPASETLCILNNLVKKIFE
jgi:hypothetical protein